MCAKRGTWYPRGLTCSNTNTKAQHLFQVRLFRDSSDDERTSLNSNIDSRFTSSCSGNLRYRAQWPQPDTPEQLLLGCSVGKRDLPTYCTHVCAGDQFDDYSSLPLSKRCGRNTLLLMLSCQLLGFFVVENCLVVVVVGVSFISRFRLRPLMGTRQERPGMYLS